MISLEMKKSFLSILLLLWHVPIMASTFVAPINLLEPYNVLIRPDISGCEPYVFAMYTEGGFGSIGYNEHGNKVNVMQIWNQNQSTLEMLQGFAVNNPITKLADLLRAISADDDGVRGHIVPCANLSLRFAGAFSAYFKLPHRLMISAHLPFAMMSLSDVSYVDLTEDNTIADIEVKEQITNNLGPIINQLGQGLDIGPWHRIGFGDGICIAHWMEDFKQTKPFLKNVNVALRLGTTIPFGKKSNENLLLAFPFGNDRAGTVFGGVGLTLTLAQCLRAGFDIQLDHIFGSIRTRRIKTAPQQTELFLLERIASYEDHGLTQEFNLFGECINLLPGTSFLLGYEYLKHSDDVLSLFSNTFSYDVATNAQKLYDWTIHQIVVRFAINADAFCAQDATFAPSGSLFLRLPFNGRRATVMSTIGACLSIKF